MADKRSMEQIGPDGCLDGGVNGGAEVQTRGAQSARIHNTPSGSARVLRASLSWHRLALAIILGLSAILNLAWLPGETYANSYYAAAVKDMLTSWHNFFFVSFDAGFVSVGKPPLGLWIQALSAYLLGFNGLSLLLPQVIAGVLSVALIYHLVRRTFGTLAGLIAALALAVTPISVAVQRNNNVDALLILTLLLAAWAFIIAAERGSLRWLLLGAVVVGLGFNIKMLQAFMVVPAFYLLYLLAARTAWRRRFLHLGAATVVLLAVSLSWAAVVDLTPADQRPYVGSSPNDSVLGLIVGYNGFDRLTGVSSGSGGEIMPAGTPGGPGGNTRMNGEIGPFRLFNEQYAGQIGWLVPLAVVGLLAASWQERPNLPLDRRHAALVLWGTWFLTVATYLSVAEGGHPYYMVMLAPAIAALVGIGVVALWKDYRSPGLRGWMLPLALPGVAAVQANILVVYPDWGRWLTPAILGLALISAGFLAIARLRSRGLVEQSPYLAVAASLGVLVLLIAPTAWAAYTAWQGTTGFLPSAGPRSSQAFGPPGGPPGGGPGDPGRNADPTLVDYLLSNEGDAEYLVAASNAMSASPIILNTGEPVISLGGYNGVDPVFTAGDLTNLVEDGTVRFFLMPDRDSDGGRSRQGGPSRGGPGGGPGPEGGLPQNGSADWIENNCEKVPQELWQSSTSEGRGGPPGRARALYDCGAGGV